MLCPRGCGPAAAGTPRAQRARVSSHECARAPGGGAPMGARRDGIRGVGSKTPPLTRRESPVCSPRGAQWLLYPRPLHTPSVAHPFPCTSPSVTSVPARCTPLSIARPCPLHVSALCTSLSVAHPHPLHTPVCCTPCPLHAPHPLHTPSLAHPHPLHPSLPIAHTPSLAQPCPLHILVPCTPHPLHTPTHCTSSSIAHPKQHILAHPHNVPCTHMCTHVSAALGVCAEPPALPPPPNQRQHRN